MIMVTNVITIVIIIVTTISITTISIIIYVDKHTNYEDERWWCEEITDRNQIMRANNLFTDRRGGVQRRRDQASSSL